MKEIKDIIHTLKSIEKEPNMNSRQSYIIGSTIEHMEHLTRQACEDCIFYSVQECKHFFDCSVVRTNRFEGKKDA